MERKTTPGRTYAIYSTLGCTVTNGSEILTVPAATTTYVTAYRGDIEISDDAAECVEVFKSAPIGGSGGGGGGTITFDSTPTKGSTNAVTSGGVWTATQHQTGNICFGLGAINKAGLGATIIENWQNTVVIGREAKATADNAFRSVAIGSKAQVTWYDSVAIGDNASARRLAIAIGKSASANVDTTAVAIGCNASATANYSAVLGCYASNSTPNSIKLSARSSANTKFELSLVAGTATGDAGSILSDTPFVTGSTLKLTVYDGVSGISETLSIDAAALFTLLQTAGGTVTLTNPNA